MRKLLLLLIIIFPTLSKCQTTQDEYNYVTTGYALTIKQGLDIKKGYKMTYLGEHVSFPRYAKVYKFIRLEKATIVAYLIEYNLKDKGTEYLCVPSPKSSPDILKQYYNNLYSDSSVNASERLRLILYVTTLFITKW